LFLPIVCKFSVLRLELFAWSWASRLSIASQVPELVHLGLHQTSDIVPDGVPLTIFIKNTAFTTVSVCVRLNIIYEETPTETPACATD